MPDHMLVYVIVEQHAPHSGICSCRAKFSVHAPIEGDVIVQTRTQRPSSLPERADHVFRVAKAYQEFGIGKPVQVSPERREFHAKHVVGVYVNRVRTLSVSTPPNQSVFDQARDI